MSSKFTQEEVKAIIMEWAKDKAKQNEIVFDESFCKGSVVRYKTTKMTFLIPNNSDGKNGGFDNRTRPDHYAYEIECMKTKISLILAFSFTNISDETKIKCEKILKKYKKMPEKRETKDSNFRRLCLYKYEFTDSTNEEKIREEMDKLFYQMKGYEEFICYKMNEEKNKKAE